MCGVPAWSDREIQTDEENRTKRVLFRDSSSLPGDVKRRAWIRGAVQSRRDDRIQPWVSTQGKLQ